MKTILKKSYTSIFLFWLLNNLNAQITFEKTYNDTLNQIGHQIIQTNDNGFLITASSYPNDLNNLTYSLLKTDSLGNISWKKDFPDICKKINKTIQTKDGCYILAGQMNYNLFIYKISSTGDSVWLKEYPTGATYKQANSLIETVERDLIIVGDDFVGGMYCCHPVAFRTDSAGNYKNVYNIPEMYGRAYDVSETNDNNLIISFSSIYGGPPYPGLIKLTKGGTHLWSKIYDGHCECNVNVIENDKLLIVGSQISNSSRPYLIKTNSTGDTIWNKSNSDFNIFNSYYKAANDINGGFLLTGYNNNKDLKILKLDNNGDSIWSKIYGGFGDDMGNTIIGTKDSGFAIIGYSTSFNKSNKQIYFIKTNKDGNITSTKNIPFQWCDKIKIVPNPATSHFSINISQQDMNNDAIIEVTNILGSIVYSTLVNQNEININTLHWPAGIYMVQLKCGNVVLGQEKLIIQK